MNTAKGSIISECKELCLARHSKVVLRAHCSVEQKRKMARYEHYD